MRLRLLLFSLLHALLLPTGSRSSSAGGVAASAFASSLNFDGDAISGDLDFAFELDDDRVDLHHRSSTTKDAGNIVEAEIDTLLADDMFEDAAGASLRKVRRFSSHAFPHAMRAAVRH